MDGIHRGGSGEDEADQNPGISVSGELKMVQAECQKNPSLRLGFFENYISAFGGPPFELFTRARSCTFADLAHIDGVGSASLLYVAHDLNRFANVWREP
jgi:hypothetical protein